MSRLILLRHGKSDRDASWPSDHVRPLHSRGVEAARAIGKALTRLGEIPELVISSTAARAESTARLAAEAGGWTCPLLLEDLLYSSSPGTVLSIVQRTDPRIERVLLVGHDPTFSDTASILIGGGRLAFKTATAAAIDLESWSTAEPSAGELAWMLNPRLFTG